MWTCRHYDCQRENPEGNTACWHCGRLPGDEALSAPTPNYDETLLDQLNVLAECVLGWKESFPDASRRIAKSAFNLFHLSAITLLAVSIIGNAFYGCGFKYHRASDPYQCAKFHNSIAWFSEPVLAYFLTGVAFGLLTRAVLPIWRIMRDRKQRSDDS